MAERLHNLEATKAPSQSRRLVSNQDSNHGCQASKHSDSKTSETRILGNISARASSNTIIVVWCPIEGNPLGTNTCDTYPSSTTTTYAYFPHIPMAQPWPIAPHISKSMVFSLVELTPKWMGDNFNVMGPL